MLLLFLFLLLLFSFFCLACEMASSGGGTNDDCDYDGGGVRWEKMDRIKKKKKTSFYYDHGSRKYPYPSCPSVHIHKTKEKAARPGPAVQWPPPPGCWPTTHTCLLLRQRPFCLDGQTPSGATLRLAYEPPPLKKTNRRLSSRCWLDQCRPPLGWSRRVPAPTFLLADPSFILQAMSEDTLTATWASRKHAGVTE